MLTLSSSPSKGSEKSLHGAQHSRNLEPDDEATRIFSRPEELMTDLNSASAEQLDAVEGLKGHGYEIVRYRGERGGFSELRQLDEVPGMAGVLDDSIRAQLTV